MNYINWSYKSKYSSSPKDILKSEKNKKKKEREKIYTKETTSKAATTATTAFLSKIPNRKKISNEEFNLYEEET